MLKQNKRTRKAPQERHYGKVPTKKQVADEEPDRWDEAAGDVTALFEGQKKNQLYKDIDIDIDKIM